MEDKPEIVSVEWTHRHYVKDDEYIPHGEDIEAFLKREIAKPIIRWQDSPQLGYEILPNKYFYRYQPPTPAKELLAEFWRLEKEAEKMLEGLARPMTSLPKSSDQAPWAETLPDGWRLRRLKCCGKHPLRIRSAASRTLIWSGNGSCNGRRCWNDPNNKFSAG